MPYMTGITLGPSPLSYCPPLASKSGACDGLDLASGGEKEGRWRKTLSLGVTCIYHRTSKYIDKFSSLGLFCFSWFTLR